MLGRIWNTAKAAIAIIALIAAALVSADRLDRQQTARLGGPAAVDPVATGSVGQPSAR